jgi:hypothetical protein
MAASLNEVRPYPANVLPPLTRRECEIVLQQLAGPQPIVAVD